MPSEPKPTESAARASAPQAGSASANGGDLSPELRAKIDQVCGGLDLLQEDTGVPRNIRRGADEAKQALLKMEAPLDVRKSRAIGILDELANDPNIPVHGRTLVWQIMSQLEPLA